MHAAHLWYSSVPLQWDYWSTPTAVLLLLAFQIQIFEGEGLRDRSLFILSSYIMWTSGDGGYVCFSFLRGKKGQWREYTMQFLSVMNWTKPTSCGISWTCHKTGTGSTDLNHWWNATYSVLCAAAGSHDKPVFKVGHSCPPFLRMMLFPKEAGVNRENSTMSNVFPLSQCSCMQLYWGI